MRIISIIVVLAASATSIKSGQAACIGTCQRWTYDQIAQVAYNNGNRFSGGPLVVSIAVAAAESDRYVNAGGDLNNPGSCNNYPCTNCYCSIGLWQINKCCHNYSQQYLLDGNNNAAATYSVSNGAVDANWLPWSAFTNGSFEAYLSSARSAASSIDSTVITGAQNRVRAAPIGASTLNVRSQPGGSVSSSVAAGTLGTVVLGPTVAVIGSGSYRFIWWRIQWDSGAIGWSAEEYLERIPATSPADLSFVFVDVVNPASSYTPGSPIHLGFRIQNTGGSTSASGTVAFYLSTDTTITASDRFLVPYTLPGINAGGTASYETSPDPTLPGNLPDGIYYVGGIISVSDGNPNNNTGYEPSPITVCTNCCVSSSQCGSCDVCEVGQCVPVSCGSCRQCNNNHGCSLKPDGSSCGNPAADLCDNPDTCNSLGDCLANNLSNGTACADDGSECTIDACNGGTCTHSNKASGTACTADANACTNDVCNGSGLCTHPNKQVGSACGNPAAGLCDNPDTCNSSGVCIANNLANGTACADDGNECTSDTCNGSGICLHQVKADGTSCTDNGFFCDGAESCQNGICTFSGDPCNPGQACDEVNNQCLGGCPAGVISWVDPPNGSVDARQPHPAGNSNLLQGFQTLIAAGPGGARMTCWTICERNSFGGPNSISNIVEGPAGKYTITLSRPITLGSTTTLTYTPDSGAASVGVFISHPANVNGDSIASPSDILVLIDNLNDVLNSPLELRQCDIDRSGVCTPADILTEIDLLNGSSGFSAWNGTARPFSSCP